MGCRGSTAAGSTGGTMSPLSSSLLPMAYLEWSPAVLKLHPAQLLCRLNGGLMAEKVPALSRAVASWLSVTAWASSSFVWLCRAVPSAASRCSQPGEQRQRMEC